MIKLIITLFKRIFREKHNHCYYIHSNNMLPPPLDEDEETKLLLEVQNGSLDARNTLIVHNLRLVVFISKKFESTKIALEDLISIGTLGLVTAGVYAYNEEQEALNSSVITSKEELGAFKTTLLENEKEIVGVETEKDASEIIKNCIARGVLAIKAKNKVRLLPALNIPFETLKKAIAIIKEEIEK